MHVYIVEIMGARNSEKAVLGRLFVDGPRAGIWLKGRNRKE